MIVLCFSDHASSSSTSSSLIHSTNELLALDWVNRAKGSFGEKFPEMGIDYSKLVVEINEIDCGAMDCLPEKLENWLNDPEALRQKQLEIAKYARLFSYGMQQNAFKYADAMSALLVRARHYVIHEAASSSTKSEAR